ncbi:MAG TPA: hypothetical protein DDW65_07810 [Firmicutes bacterium]|jgi:hypothetical protein|nr:hypothetical protein [Bacillota bacterium]
MNNIDPQITGMAGEFLTVGKLFKKGLQASVTFGNAKAVDVLAYNPVNNKNYNVQVKTLRKKNCFLIKKENIISDHIYVFIILNDFERDEDYYIINGSDILKDPNAFFGSSYAHEVPSSMPAINLGPLKDYKDNWRLFE